MVKEARLDLKEKLRYGDEIEVSHIGCGMKSAQFSMHHKVLKEGRVAAEGDTLMVCVDGAGKLKRLPPEFRRKLELQILNV